MSCVVPVRVQGIPDPKGYLNLCYVFMLLPWRKIRFWTHYKERSRWHDFNDWQSLTTSIGLGFPLPCNSGSLTSFHSLCCGELKASLSYRRPDYRQLINPGQATASHHASPQQIKHKFSQSSLPCSSARLIHLIALSKCYKFHVLLLIKHNNISQQPLNPVYPWEVCFNLFFEVNFLFLMMPG